MNDSQSKSESDPRKEYEFGKWIYVYGLSEGFRYRCFDSLNNRIIESASYHMELRQVAHDIQMICCGRGKRRQIEILVEVGEISGIPLMRLPASL